MQRYLRTTITHLLLMAILLLNCSKLSGQWHIPTIGGALPNSATSLGNACFQMTSAGNTRGVIWDSIQINLSQPFDITLNINQQPFGADGLALVMQNVGLTANGAGANALGFGNSLPPSPGYPPIVNSIAFEVDTWDNSGAGVADIAQDHVAIHTNGNMANAIGTPVAALASGNDITDGLCHRFRVTWNPITTNIRIFFDADPTPRINLNYNMVGLVFGGNPLVWWGFTASSGGAAMTQTICVGANFGQAGVDRSVCPNDTLRLQARGGNAFVWNPAGPLLSSGIVSNPIFGPTSPGIYPFQVSVSNSALCTDIDSVTVTVDPYPVANAGGVGNLCLGDSAQLGVPPNPNYSYLWQPAVGLSSATVAQPWLAPSLAGALSYTLIVTDLNGLAGCKDTTLINLIARDTPTVAASAVNDTICVGLSTLLTAIGSNGTGPYGYTWGNGPLGSTQTVNPSATTIYVVQVADAFSCTTSATVTVIVNDTPTVGLSALPDSICAGQTSFLSSNIIGGTPAYSYLWNSGAIGAADTIAPLASIYALLTVTDAMGCTGVGNVAIVVNVSDSIDIATADTLLCLGGNLQIAGTFATSGINAWLWTPALGVSNPNNPNPVISPTVSTTYALNGLSTLTGCGYTDSITIIYNPLGPPTADLGADDTLCLGQSLLLLAGNAGFGHIWSDSSSGASYVATTQGWVALSVFDTVGCGYYETDSIFLTVNALPLPNLGPDTTLCPLDSLLLDGGVAANTYIWNTGASTNTIWANVAGSYQLQVIDSNGCINADTMVLGFSPIFMATVSGLGASYCISDSAAQLVATPASGIFLGNVSATGLFTPSIAGAGLHTIKYAFTDSIGCSQFDTVITVVSPLPSIAQAGPDLIGGESLQLAGNTPQVGTGIWSLVGGSGGLLSNPLDPQATISQLTGGTYSLVWTISNPPCPASADTLRITVEAVSLPNGFSPNGDGVNDLFVIGGIAAYGEAKLSIFNRWGNVVWSAESYANQWDGRSNDGQVLVEDTYYAILSYGSKMTNTFVVLKR